MARRELSEEALQELLAVGRTLRVIAAAGSMLTNFAFVPVSPVWSTVMIPINTGVICALTPTDETSSPNSDRSERNASSRARLDGDP